MAGLHPTYVAGSLTYIADLNSLSDSLDRRLLDPWPINGILQVWQRGTSFAVGATAGIYTADRWLAGRTGSVAGLTVSRQTGDTQMQYCARVQRDSANAATNVINFWQPFEGTDVIRMRSSYWAIAVRARRGANYSAASNILTAEVRYGTTADQRGIVTAFTGDALVGSGNMTLTTTFQDFYIAIGTLNAAAQAMAINFKYTPVGAAGAADYFEIGDIRMVPCDSNGYVGSYPLEPIADLIKRCERYYQKSFGLGVTPVQNAGTTGAHAFIQAVGASTATTASAPVQFRSRMRNTPTVTLYNPSAANAQARNVTTSVDWSGSTASEVDYNGFIVTGTTGAGTAAGGRSLVHYTADAEL